MSLHPQMYFRVPEDTERVACAIFPQDNLVMRIYDDLGIENLQGALNVEGSNPEGGEATHFSLMNVERGHLNPRTRDQITRLMQRPWLPLNRR